MKLKYIFIAFLLLIVCAVVGITGSNLQLANNWQVVNVKQKLIFGEYQGIRSDEWGVITPLCLSQMQHKPSFPIVNKTIDVEGKNMLIVHDYGVPVKHISSIAKPTTWGYFTGNIRFGMSWNWLVPIFIGFVGVTLIFDLLLGRQWFNMLLALAVVYAPICAAWSNFPLYELGLGGVAAWAFLETLKEENKYKKLACSVICGWAASAFALTLYLPRLIPMTWLYLGFITAILIKDKLYRKILDRWAYILLSIGIIGIILGSWYFDAKNGIDSILSSTYPGNRVILGGNFGLFDFVRGWFPYQLVNRQATFSNQSELSSFPNLLLIIVPMVCSYWASFKGEKKIVYIFAGLLAFFYYYQYVGFPLLLAKATAMGKSHPPRVESSVMFLQLLLLSYYLKNCSWERISKQRSLFGNIVGFAISIAVLVGFIFRYNDDQVGVYIWSASKVYVLFLSILFALIPMVINKSWRIGLTLIVLLYAIPGFLFNPVTRAPKYIASALPSYITETRGTNQSRVLFLANSPWEANTGNMLGLASLDGVHHYIDGQMYNNYYSKLKDGEQFKRFNHTYFSVDNKIADYTCVIPSGDCIEWKINAQKFNFRALPIKYLIAERGYKQDLLQNENLIFIEEKGRFVYFGIKC